MHCPICFRNAIVPENGSRQTIYTLHGTFEHGALHWFRIIGLFKIKSQLGIPISDYRNNTDNRGDYDTVHKFSQTQDKS